MSAIRELDVVRLRGWQVGIDESVDVERPRPVYPGTIGTVVFMREGSDWAMVEVVSKEGWTSTTFSARLAELEPVWRLGVGPLVPTRRRRR